MNQARLKDTSPGKGHTYEDYRKLPEGAPCQLIGGELVMEPAPATYHQEILTNLMLEMASFVRKNQLGKVLAAPVDVYLDEYNVFQPDLLFVSQQRLPVIETGKINGAPDLVVEILSPGSVYYDLRKKYRTYEKAGVPEYWIVDPEEQSVQVFVLADGAYQLKQEVFEKGPVASVAITGFSMEVENVFYK